MADSGRWVICLMSCRVIRLNCVPLPRLCWSAAPGSSGCSSLQKMCTSVDRQKSLTLISFSLF
jgi:hypothetical protein